MSLDKKLVDMLSLFMTKVGSITNASKAFNNHASRMMDKEDQQKVASASAHRDRAEFLAHKLSETRLPSGATFIEGFEQIKQASFMLGDHDKALDIFEMVLDACSKDKAKSAAIEPGYPYSVPEYKESEMSADDYLIYKTLGPNAIAPKK
jgi:hypothetical protein